MFKRAHRLPAILLICLTTAWPACANPPAPTSESLTVSRSAPAEADDRLRLWFQEQDRLLDDILLRLARIETLVADIHRLVRALPAIPVPASVPVAPQPPVGAHAREASSLTDWLPQLAGGGLLIVLLLWWARQRRAAAKTPAAPAGAVPPAPTSPPDRHAQPEPPSATMSGGASARSSNDADQAIELAEIMLSMGLGHGAAQTLTEQIRNEPKQALRQWLKLLEVYRRNGNQEDFERSAEELRKHFNVQPEDWQGRPESERSIANYPHIANRLTELWGKPGCLDYLQHLLGDNRGGARAGFPQPVAEELLLLGALIRSGEIPG